MSAASQAREQARIQKLMLKRYPDIPEPHEPPTPLDADLEQRLTWFIQNRREIAKAYNCHKIVLHDDGGPAEIWVKR